MARITLRDYNNEINDLIDHGQIEEAIAHCRHILTTYPKHVETYRLLGKAYLEQKRYSDASDLLQRVLSSIPDDFISHVGMSIIREDEGNLDTAIYHMEMAFESQPSNHAIQDDLRRLFEKRDGIEPPRLRLTRGALARMYAHGNLYEQAISEIMAALSEEPQRYDLQTLLAEMLHQADKVVEAAEACTKILEKLPYNLSGNRLLATILRDSDRDEDAQRFYIRWQALDPYAAFITPPLTQSDQVPDNAVTVDRENWEPSFGGALGGEAPAWASSQAKPLDGEEIPKDIPDWLSTPSEELTDMPTADAVPSVDPSGGEWLASDASAVDSPFGSPSEDPAADQWMSEFSSEEPEKEAEGAADWLSDPVVEPPPASDTTSSDLLEEDPTEEPFAETSKEEQLPEFMQEAGWGTDSGDSSDSSGVDLELPDTPAVEGEVPEWMKEMAPAEDAAPSEPDLGVLGEIQAEPDPDWLESMQEESKETDASWIGELGEAEEPASPTEIPSREADPAAFLAGDFGEDDTDDWLASFPTDKASQPGEEDPEEKEKVSGYLAGDYGEDDTDDWLASLSSGEKGAKPVKIEIGSADETVPGSESLTAPEGVDIFGSDESADDIPPATPEPVEPAAAVVDPAADQEGEGLAWMESLAAKQGIAEEELVTSPDERVSFEDDQTPDWLSAAEQPESSDPIESDGLSDLLDAAPPVEDVEIPEAAEPASDDEQSMDWLTSISEEAAAQAVEADQPLENADALESLAELSGSADPADNLEALFEEPPEKSAEDSGLDWLQQISEEPAVDASVEEDLLAVDSDDLANLFGEASPAVPEEASKAEQKTPTTPLGDLASFTAPDEDLAALFEEPQAKPAAQPAAEEQPANDWPEVLGEAPHTDELPQIVPPAEFAGEFGDLFPDQQTAAEETPILEGTDTVDNDTAMDWLGSLTGAPAEDPDSDDPILESPGIEELPEIEAVEVEAIPADQPPPQTPTEGEDEGIAWLENLASEPDAPEEDLITTPEKSGTFSDDRTPDWLTEIEEDDQTDEEITMVDDLDDLDALLEEVEGLSDSLPVAPVKAILENEDDFSMDWLDSISEEAASEAGAGQPETPMAAEQAADNLANLIAEEPPTAEPEKPLPPLPANASETVQLEERFTEDGNLIDPEGDITPEWLKIIKEEDKPTPAAGPEPISVPEPEPEPEDLVDDFLKELQTPEPEVEEMEISAPPVESPVEPIMTDDDEFSIDWLEEISGEAAAEAAEDVEVATDPIAEEVEAPLETISETPIESDETEEVVPDWLDTIEEDQAEPGFDAELEDLTAIFGDEDAIEETPIETTVEDSPASTAEEEVPDWLQEIGDEKPEPVPQLPLEMFAEMEEPEPVEAASEAEAVPVVEPEAQPVSEAETESPPPAETPAAAPEPLDEVVAEAKSAIQQGELDDAVKQFAKIIKKGKVVDQAIVEIKDALRRHPVNVDLWQVLGDAYMKVNNLQDALDAYSKAENLLR